MYEASSCLEDYFICNDTFYELEVYLNVKII